MVKKIEKEKVKHGSLNSDTSKTDELNVYQKGRILFSYDSYMWKVIHIKKKSKFGKENLGFTLGIVDDAIDLYVILSRIKAETLNEHAAELIPTNAIVLLPLVYRHQAFLKSKKKISWSG